MISMTGVVHRRLATGRSQASLYFKAFVNLSGRQAGKLSMQTEELPFELLGCMLCLSPENEQQSGHNERK